MNQNPLLVLNEPSHLDFITLLLKFTYSDYGISDKTIHDILDIFLTHIHDPETAALKLQTELLLVTEDGSVLIKRYRQYKKRKNDLLLNFLGQYVQGPVYADVGAGTGSFAKRILRYSNNFSKIIATEIESRPISDSQKLDFRTHNSHTPELLPIQNEETNTISFINVLHHLVKEKTKISIDEAYRSLKRGGTLIVLEDSFSLTLKPQFNTPGIIEKFLKLKSKERLLIYQFMDWYTTRAIEGVKGMPYPFNYRTLEEWEVVLASAGFSHITLTFLGLQPGAFHAIPKGLIIAKKQ